MVNEHGLLVEEDLHSELTSDQESLLGAPHEEESDLARAFGNQSQSDSSDEEEQGDRTDFDEQASQSGRPEFQDPQYQP